MKRYISKIYCNQRIEKFEKCRGIRIKIFFKGLKESIKIFNIFKIKLITRWDMLLSRIFYFTRRK